MASPHWPKAPGAGGLSRDVGVCPSTACILLPGQKRVKGLPIRSVIQRHLKEKGVPFFSRKSEDTKRDAFHPLLLR